MEGKGIICTAYDTTDDGKEQCKLCHKKLASNAYRLATHFKGGSTDGQVCPHVDQLDVSIRQALVKGQDHIMGAKRARPQDQMSLAQFVDCSKAHAADRAIAELFYGCSVRCNVARQYPFRDAMRAVSQAGPSYKPPGSEKLRTSLLEDRKAALRLPVQR